MSSERFACKMDCPTAGIGNQCTYVAVRGGMRQLFTRTITILYPSNRRDTSALLKTRGITDDEKGEDERRDREKRFSTRDDRGI